VAGLATEETAERWRRPLVLLAPATFVPALGLALLGPAAGTVGSDWLLFGTYLEVDQLARPLLLVAAILYAVAAVTIATNRTPRAATLTGFLLVAFTGNFGVLVAADVVTFYLSFAVMSFAGFGLVTHKRTDLVRRAGRVYLTVAILGEAAILGALLFIVSEGGVLVADAPAAVVASDATGLIVALLLVGFGAKAGTVPLHVWLPVAYPAAPSAASAVLSGCMSKAGLVGWIRFLPIGEEAQPGWGLLLGSLALTGAFLGVLIGVLQSDPKVVLAYSSVSQMGFMTVLVGAALAAPELADAAVVAVVLYAVHHGLAKGALFLGVPLWRRYRSRALRWWIAGALLGASLAVAGAPLSSGAVAKYAAKDAVDHNALIAGDLVVYLQVVAVGSTILLARFALLLLAGPRQQPRSVDAPLVAWSVVVVAGSSLSWLLAGTWIPVAALPELVPATLWAATWPVLLGLTIAGLTSVMAQHGSLPAWFSHPHGRHLPPGDVIVVGEVLVRRGWRAVLAVALLTAEVAAVVGALLGTVLRRIAALGGVLRSGEQQLRVWEVSGAVTLVLAVGFVVAAVVR
jgi:formate hydrogenlyase subunit 3/multisubunit Na+/H+ antiporter MnhD subunit